MLVALTREPSSSLGAGERTFRPRAPVDVETARLQHREYRRALSECGAHVVELPALDDLPDAVFVEDTAIVLDEIVLLLTMGVASRVAEREWIEPELARWSEVVRLPDDCRADGGDVLRLGRTLYVGRSRRTDESGIRAIAALVSPLGYRVIPVPVTGCLHLKSACTALDEEQVLVNAGWIDPSPLEAGIVEVHAEEPGAANVVRAGDAVLFQAGYPRTAERVREAGFDVRTVDVSEIAKAEGSLSCLSLLFDGYLEGA